MKERSLFGNAPTQQTLSLDNAGEARRRVEVALAACGSASLEDVLRLAKDAAAASPNDARIAQAVLTLRAAGVALANAARLLADARRDAHGADSHGSSPAGGMLVDRERTTDEIAGQP